MASLVMGVKVLNRDRRRKNRQGSEAFAPPWWESFDFKLARILDDHGNIFGAVFKYRSFSRDDVHKSQKPPRYVVAFRGTTSPKDQKWNVSIILNNFHQSKAFKEVALRAVINAVNEAGDAAAVWLAGHSLGAAMALLAGSTMVVQFRNFELQAFLFNPPFPSISVEPWIRHERITKFVSTAKTFIKTSIVTAIPKIAGDNSEFLSLCGWRPRLFVNPRDLICTGYIGHFESMKKKMANHGAGEGECLAAQHSTISLLSGALGFDAKPFHLIPSAYLTVVQKPMSRCPHCQLWKLKKNHNISQWWDGHLDTHCQTQLYKHRPSH